MKPFIELGPLTLRVKEVVTSDLELLIDRSRRFSDGRRKLETLKKTCEPKGEQTPLREAQFPHAQPGC